MAGIAVLVALVIAPSAQAEGVGFRYTNTGEHRLFQYCEPVSNAWFAGYASEGYMEAGTYDASGNFHPAGPRIPWSGMRYEYQGPC